LRSEFELTRSAFAFARLVLENLLNRLDAHLLVFFAMANRGSLMRQYRKNGACEEIVVYRGDFSQTTLGATRCPKFYLPKKFEIEHLQRRLPAQARHA
jgi:hypothetical protein